MSHSPLLIASQTEARTLVGMHHLSLGMWRPSEVMWPSHDDHATMCHLSHLIGRPPSWWIWDLRVPTLFLFHLFPSYCANASFIAPQQLYAYLPSFLTQSLIIYSPMLCSH